MAKTNVYIDGTQAGNTLKEIKRNVAVLNKEISQLPVGSEKYNQKLKALSGESARLTEHRKQIRGIGDAYKPANAGIGSMMKQFAPMAFGIGIVTTAVGGIVSGIKSWVNNSLKLEKSLSSLKALTGASAEDIKFYKEEAIQMGKTTTLSATQVVDAMKLIGSAKPELLKNRDALAAVTKEAITLAEAGEIDLATSAQAVTGALNQWGEAADQSGRFINVFAAGSKEGAANIADLSQSIDKSGAVLDGYNVSIEEGVGLLETMAEKNLKGAEAGTQLRNVMLTMQGIEALPQKALDALEQYGVDTALVADKTVPLNERLAEMSKISGDATAMMQVFGKENIVAGNAILANVDKVEKYTDAVTGTSTAYEQAAINTDNLDGDLKGLGSAWEGLTLSFAGSESVFRPLVQAGTDTLNWLSDTITAVKEFDATGMETQIMKLTRSLPFLSDEMTYMLDTQIRINELSTEVMDAMRGEAESATVLTHAIHENNLAMQDATLTAEEKAEIEAQNAQMIQTLNERYPELTENMDLNTASGEELNKLQKQINANLLTQALNAAKAAEAERLLGSIIELTMKQSRLRQQIQSAKGGNLAEGLAAAEALEELQEVNKELGNTKKDFASLEKTMGQVGKTIEDMDVNFGVGFEANAGLAADSAKKMEVLNDKLAKTSNAKVKKVLEAEIKAHKSILASTKKTRDEQIEAATAVQEAEQLTAEVLQETEKQSVKNAKTAEKHHKEVVKQLENLINSTERLAQEQDYNAKLEAFTDEQEKEIFVLENAIEEKYAKEIASAENLAKEKGSIGIHAQEELNALLALKERELVDEKLKINNKYAAEKLASETEEQKKSNLIYLQQQESLEEAKISLQLYKAQKAWDLSQGMSKEHQDEAMRDLTKALTDQAELEKKRQLEKLMDMRDTDEISITEFNLRKQELEQEHQDIIDSIINEKEVERMARSQERATAALESIATVIGIFDDLANAQFEKQVASIDKQKKNELKAVEEKKRKGLITEEEYQKQKEEIELRGEEARKKAENEKAKKDKEVALFQAAINTAMAVVKAAPNPITMALAAAVGVAQLAIIAGKEVPQYVDGGYANVIGASDGKMYSAKNVGRLGAGMTPSNPSLALISEEGPEYFVPNGLLRHHAVAQHVAAIDAIRTNQYAEGGYTSAAGGMNNDELTAVLRANLAMMSALSAQIPNMKATIPDRTIDDINDREAELNAMRN